MASLSDKLLTSMTCWKSIRKNLENLVTVKEGDSKISGHQLSMLEMLDFVDMLLDLVDMLDNLDLRYTQAKDGHIMKLSHDFLLKLDMFVFWTKWTH